MKRTTKATLLTATVILLASMQSFADIVGSGGIMGPTNNIGIPPADRTDIDINRNHAGSVGQVDWRQPNIPTQSQLNFNFEGLQQTMIQRVEGGKTQDILNKISPSVEKIDSEIVQLNKSFSPVEQTYIHRVEGGKTQDILNKITPAPGSYTTTMTQSGDIVINTK